MLTRNLCSVMCIVTLLLMGVAATNDSTTSDLAEGDCSCVEYPCEKEQCDEVNCYYWDKDYTCTCHEIDCVFYLVLDPRRRVCEDGPNPGDMACECACAGTDAPGCEECVSTCDDYIEGVAPDPDPCRVADWDRTRCLGLGDVDPQTCEPKIPLPAKNA